MNVQIVVEYFFCFVFYLFTCFFYFLSPDFTGVLGVVVCMVYGLIARIGCQPSQWKVLSLFGLGSYLYPFVSPCCPKYYCNAVVER